MAHKILFDLLLSVAIFCVIDCTRKSSNPLSVPSSNDQKGHLQQSRSSNKSSPQALAHFIANSTNPPSPMEEGVFVNQKHSWVAGFHLKRTKDGAQHWEEMTPVPEDEALFGNVGQQYLRPFFLTPMRGWLIAGEGTWQTDDGGSTWQLLFPRGSDLPAFADERHGWIDVVASETTDQSYITNDAGETWRPCGAQRDDSRQMPAGVAYFLTSKIGWAITGQTRERKTIYGVAHTVDGGCSWQQLWVSKNNPDEWYTDVHFINESEGWLAGKANGSLYHTTSGGKTWNNLPLPHEGAKVTHVYFVNHKEGWIIIK